MFSGGYLFESSYMVINAVLLSSTTYKSNLNVPDYLLYMTDNQLYNLKFILIFFQILWNTLFGWFILNRWSTLSKDVNLYLKTVSFSIVILSGIIVITYIFIGNIARIGNLSSLQIFRSPMLVILIIIAILVKRKLENKAFFKLK